MVYLGFYGGFMSGRLIFFRLGCVSSLCRWHVRIPVGHVVAISEGLYVVFQIL